jgi:chorismate dehydratase
MSVALDFPSACAQKLIAGEVDLGLIPIAVLSKLTESYIISDYCIGAEGKVGSVMLFSNVPLSEIKNVLLDYQSFTSVALVKILAKKFWKIKPDWVPAEIDFEKNIKENTAAVIIGDRTFGLQTQYAYSYDLAEEWQKFTQLPFVFACWVANKQLPDSFIKEFNEALKYGINNRDLLIAELTEKNNYPTDIAVYLNENIKFDFGSSQKKALDLFLNYLSTMD